MWPAPIRDPALSPDDFDRVTQPHHEGGLMRAELRDRHRQPPAWWRDAKLGVFIHWIPASVPGYAPTNTRIGDLMQAGGPHPLSEIPYSEWYQNSMRFPGSSVDRYHREHYGTRPYEAFADDFAAALDQWDPTAWARTIAATGARYIILVTKHHDGWCLWPSGVTNPNRAGWFSERDIVGELAEAVRAEGVRFGVYYSGAYDWTFETSPIGTVGSGIAAIPGGDYPAYADAQVRELIDRYRPSVLWNDIGWPAPQEQLDDLFEYYFSVVPDGAVNDRWMPTNKVLRLAGSPAVRPLIDGILRRSAKKSGGLVPPDPPFFQYKTPEFVSFDGVQRQPFETVRGFDHGFGFNRTSAEDDFLDREELEQLLVGSAATGGNLVINIGPRGEDAQIPDEQQRRLDWLAELEPLTARALRGTRPWVTPTAQSAEGHSVSFTASGDDVFAWCWPPDGRTISTLTLSNSALFSSSATGFTAADAAADVEHDLEIAPATGPGATVTIEVPDHLAAASPFVIRFRHDERRPNGS